MPLEWNAKEINMQTLERTLEKVHPEADLIVLPETFSTGFPSRENKENVRQLAERNTGETIDRLKQLAEKHKIAIAGSFIADSGGSLYNRAFFIEPTGDEYFEDKRHLFSMAGEQDIFSRGYSRMRLRYRGWNIAMVVCYDIRFPVWCRNVANEYDVLLAVANWPNVRIGAWNALLPARAIENLAYVCGVNCCGTDPAGFEYGGAAAVYDYKGKDISVADEANGLRYATLSRTRLDDFRKKFPAWADADEFRL